ncbi:MAG: helix-turn-helix domain-containing protein [Desulfobacter sp.]|nr:MAG: helix-turn-helix domain-containing protein [Desulfobacter sp.]
MKKVKKSLSPFGLNTNDAAKFLGCSEALLRKMRGQGTGPAYSKLGGKKISYPVPELKKFMKDNLVKTAG